jgi:hypothetical protein
MTSRTSDRSSSKRDNKKGLSKIGVSVNQTPVPRLPHERDESADGVGSEPRKPIQQAAADIQKGLKDTDRSSEVDKTYKKLKSAS